CLKERATNLPKYQIQMPPMLIALLVDTSGENTQTTPIMIPTQLLENRIWMWASSVMQNCCSFMQKPKLKPMTSTLLYQKPLIKSAGEHTCLKSAPIFHKPNCAQLYDMNVKLNFAMMDCAGMISVAGTSHHKS